MRGDAFLINPLATSRGMALHGQPPCVMLKGRGGFTAGSKEA